MASKIYELQLQGVVCTVCSNKINKALAQPQFDSRVLKSHVNVLSERLYVTISDLDQEILDDVQSCMSMLGFKPVGKPKCLSNQSSEQKRILTLIVKGVVPQGIQLNGILKLTVIEIIQQEKKVQIQYETAFTSGRQIFDHISRTNEVRVFNQRIEQINAQNRQQLKNNSILKAVLIIAFFVVFDMFLPLIKSFEATMVFPQSNSRLGVFSFYVIANYIITIYTIYLFGLKTYSKAYHSYVDFRVFSMETLISLGSLSALLLALLKTAQALFYSQRGHEVVMGVVDSLMSTSLILGIVAVGKHLQEKAKSKIVKMANDIFPETQLFKDLEAIYFQPKNKQFAPEFEKRYDVLLFEKKDLIRLEPSRIVHDFVLLHGQATGIDSIVSGCDDLVTFKKGDRIRSGSQIKQVNDAIVQVQAVFQDSMLLKFGNQISIGQDQTELNQTSVQIMCKKLADNFVLFVIIFSLLTATGWLIYFSIKGQQVQCKLCLVLERMVSVLVVSCPCALGLAIPSVISISLNMAIKLGILIRKNLVFERAGKTNIICFDKTGTLFTKVKEIHSFQVLGKDFAPPLLWQIVSLIEKQFKHPLAQVLYKQALSKSGVNGFSNSFKLDSKPIQERRGVSGQVFWTAKNKSLQVLIGNKLFLQQKGLQVKSQIKNNFTVLYLAINRTVKLQIRLDTHSNIRPQAIQVVEALKLMGKQVHILSGDSVESVHSVGKMLGIKQQFLHGSMTSADKKDWIKSKKQQGEGVMMIGDGLNDIPCLQESSIGVSINAKSELNLIASDIILLSENLQRIYNFFRLMRNATLIIKLNLFEAFLYNLFMLPVAAGFLSHFNIQIKPYVSSLAMSLSSLLVVLTSNIMTLLSIDLKRTNTPIRPNVAQMQIEIESTYTNRTQKQKLLNE